MSEDAFDASVLYRIVRGDVKGRRFGTPGNPRLPTLEEFNPRFLEIRAGDLAAAIVSRRHGILPELAASFEQLSEDDLVRFRAEDPISATGTESELALTGGHHRVHEIVKRVAAGRLAAETMVRVLLHD